MAGRRTGRVGAFLYVTTTVGCAMGSLAVLMFARSGMTPEASSSWAVGGLAWGGAFAALASLTLFIAVGTTRFLQQQRARAFKTGVLVAVTAAALVALLEWAGAARPGGEASVETPVAEAPGLDGQAVPDTADGASAGLLGVAVQGTVTGTPRVGQ